MFDVCVVDGLEAGGALLGALLAGAVDGLAEGVAGVAGEPAGVSFFSPAVGAAFSPSDGGFNLLE